MFHIYLGSGQYLMHGAVARLSNVVHTVQNKKSAERLKRFQAIEVLRLVRMHGFSAWIVPE